MANTYHKIYLQFVIAVKNRQSLILPEWEADLQKYITGIVQGYDHKMIAINGMPDHQHIFIGLNPKQSVSDVMEIVKGNSSKWINDHIMSKGKFNWQKGYGVFSYSKSQVDRVYKYIMNQKNHHKRRTFLEEYVDMLQKFGIEYDEKYIFDEIYIG